MRLRTGILAAVGLVACLALTASVSEACGGRSAPTAGGPVFSFTQPGHLAVLQPQPVVAVQPVVLQQAGHVQAFVAQPVKARRARFRSVQRVRSW